MTTSPRYDSISIKKLPKSKVEITGSIPVKEFNSHRKEALKYLNEHLDIKGFRKGKIPDNVLVSKVDPMAILEEMAEIALSKAYPHILIDQKIDAIGRPEIKITKMAEDNPLEFTITTTVIPEVKLPDYKKIAKKIIDKPDEVITVTPDEVEATILEIRKSRVDHSGHEHGSMSKEEHEKLIMESLPPLTNEFVQSLGDFVDIEDFKKKVEDNIVKDKEKKQHDKKRSELIENLISESEIDIPDILVQSEVGRIESQFMYDLDSMQIPLADYLKHIKKTIEDLRKDWIPQAEKKAKIQIVLNKIAEKESLKPDAKRVEEETNAILAEHKTAERDRVQVFVETLIVNEMVFDLLEGREATKEE